MSNRTMSVLWSCLFSLLIVSNLNAEDWPRWRGSDFTGVSKERIGGSWPRSGPKKLWTSKEGGLGYAGFSVVNDVVYTMGAFGQKECLLAFDSKKNGRLVFKTEIGRLLKNGWGDGPRSTPTYDDGKLYAMSGQGNITCVDAKSGRILWQKSMAGFGGKTPNWGYTESPLVDGDLVICTPGGKKGAVVALGKARGNLVWQSKGYGAKAQYSSVQPIEWAGKKQYIQLTMSDVISLDAKTGKLLWKSQWPGKTAVIPTPVYHDGHVFVSSGYGVGCKLIKLSGSNKPSDVYSSKTMKNHHGGVILKDGYLYGASDGRGLMCMNMKTGKEAWNAKKATRKGAVALVGDKLIFLEEGTGAVVLAQASPNGYKELGRFTLSPQSNQRASKGKIWVHPVVSNGKLYLRDQEIIYCFEV